MSLQDLYINVALNVGGAIRGRLVLQQLSTASANLRPVLLLPGEGSAAPNDATGVAWASVDSTCVLHYQVTLTSASTCV